MAIIRCKMCGGDVELAADKTFGTCECCGSSMTFPKVSDDQRASAFNRGNHFRRIGEFDKALAVYERIVGEDNTDAEAHWCCALCRFGIEYVEDPATFEWLPTCHRASFDSFLEDVDYLAALEYSDGITRRQYQRDAAKIAEVQRGILATSQNEEPFDVFICYKETDESGQRTRDSLLAQEIYYQLTEQGRRVFFSRITLEDMVGKQYEPYIFAALNSAKVMIVVGTKPEYLNAVWVKNEWSRFLAMMKKDRSKLLLPCYRDMDPYDMPEQLSVLQSYDMAKLGFIQDLTRGIAKVLDAGKPVETAPVQQTVVVQQQAAGSNVAALLKRGNMALEDLQWSKAESFFEDVLNQDPECAEAYLGNALAAERCPNLQALAEKRLRLTSSADTAKKNIVANNSRIMAAIEAYTVPGYLEAEAIDALFQYPDYTYPSCVAGRSIQLGEEKKFWSTNRHISRALQFAKGELLDQLTAVRDQVLQSMKERMEQEKADEITAKEAKLADYNAFLDNAEEKVKQLYREAQNNRHSQYLQQVSYIDTCENVEKLKQLAKDLDAWNGYEDSEAMAAKCREKADRLQREMKELGQKCMALNDAIAKLETERSGLGIFAGKRKKEIEAEIAQLNEQLDKLRAQQMQAGIPTLNEINHAFVSAGDHVYFGSYLQKALSKEPVEWTVLERRGTQLVLISTQALACVPYHKDKKRADISWEQCYLRNWLNTTFLENCFPKDLQKHLVSQHNDTVTILSAAEVKAYWPEAQKEKRCAKCTSKAFTEGALRFGAYVNGVFQLKNQYAGLDGNTIYTLRHPNTRAFVDVCNDSGMIVSGKVNIWAEDCAIRPVICVDFTK